MVKSLRRHWHQSRFRHVNGSITRNSKVISTEKALPQWTMHDSIHYHHGKKRRRESPDGV